MLADTLRDVSRRRFVLQNRLSIAFMHLARHVMDDTGMDASDVVTAQLNALVSMVQTLAPPSEWDDVSGMLAASLRQRMTIKEERH